VATTTLHSTSNLGVFSTQLLFFLIIFILSVRSFSFHSAIHASQPFWWSCDMVTILVWFTILCVSSDCRETRPPFKSHRAFFHQL